MFQTAAGVTIPFPEKIKEEFQAIEHGVRFHVSFEKLGAMLEDFIELLVEPLFFVLQIPLSRDEEQALRPGVQIKDWIGSPHDRVCYLDGQSKEQIRSILRQYGELLLNDGISQFAVASHVTYDEMFIQTYKLVDIYSKQPEKFFDLLKKHGIVPTDNLFTVWQTFSRETPGQVRKITLDGLTAYDVHEALVKEGMYEAKIIER